MEDQEKIVKNVIEPMAGDGLRTICMAYKDYHTDASKSPQRAGACCSVKDLRISNIVVRPVGILDKNGSSELLDCRIKQLKFWWLFG